MFLDFIFFGFKQLKACIFAGSFFILLFISNYIHLGHLARYDFLFLAAILIQVFMVVIRLETPKEIIFISIFHIVGLILEIYKTNPIIGSWTYPENCFFRIGTVPLYAGFMYASVGSYIMQSWKIFGLKFLPFPNKKIGILLCALIYINFFTNHWIYDVRILLLVLIFIFSFKTQVYLKPRSRVYSMPLNLGFLLIALFIWIAENMATFLGAWKYPDQNQRWHWVSFSKISSWVCLVIISFLIIAFIMQKTDSSK